MTRASLNVLDANLNGFTLMIEGGAVDWAGHDNGAGRIIEEQYDFDRSVKAVVKWIEKKSSWDETLLIVTGDHECGYFVGPDFDPDDMINTWEVTDNGKKNMPGYSFQSYGHTSMLIPIYMHGAGAEVLAKYADHDDFVLGKFLDNSEIGQAAFKMWNDLPDGEPNIDHSQIKNNWKSSEIEEELLALGNIANDEPANEELNPVPGAEELTVFPNPTDGTFNFVIEDFPAIYKLRDITGKIIMMGNINSRNYTVELNNHESGIYFLEVLSESKRYHSKIMVK
jgi:hypothetical protein